MIRGLLLQIVVLELAETAGADLFVAEHCAALLAVDVDQHLAAFLERQAWGDQRSRPGDGGDFRQQQGAQVLTCLLYTSPSPRDLSTSRMPSSA